MSIDLIFSRSWSISRPCNTMWLSFPQGWLLDFWSLGKRLTPSEMVTLPRMTVTADACPALLNIIDILYLQARVGDLSPVSRFVLCLPLPSSYSPLYLKSLHSDGLSLSLQGWPRTPLCQHSSHPSSWHLCPGCGLALEVQTGQGQPELNLREWESSVFARGTNHSTVTLTS